jgi:hypothetical protein
MEEETLVTINGEKEMVEIMARVGTNGNVELI